MLDALRFVQGAIQKNGITPELEYFQIKDGRIVGFNGYMALSSPIDLAIEAMPKADLFHKAVQACGETVSLSLTAAGRLHIRSGTFAAFIPCIEKDVYEAKPEGVLYPAPVGLAATCRRLLPFISDDASRPWAMGLSFGGGSYTVTNNIILLQVWDGNPLPVFTCPRFAVAELARYKEDPVQVQISESSVTFHYSNGKWLRTARLAEEWPVDIMNKILSEPSKPYPVPDGLFEAVEILSPFASLGASSPIYFYDDLVSTGKAGAEDGASVAVPGLAGGPAFRLKALQLLKDEVDRIDFSTHPRPCLFFGPNSRGALVGLNV